MIPVCEPLLGGRELEYATECIKTNWISSQGQYIKEFEAKFARYCGCEHGITCTSGTTALHLALASLGLGPGDEVIVPAFTMGACALAIVYTGATPVLVDSERDTWNMDMNQVADKITPKTRAVMPVHIYGHPCDMDPLKELAERHGLWVVEDAAEAHGAEYKGKKTGGLGSVGCFSFFANKIITTGEGGMVVTSESQVAEKARRLKDLAHTPGRRYLHSDLAYNYRMTNIQAAIGLAQFERIEELVEMRRTNARRYNSRLARIPGITLPVEKLWAKNVYWMYSILIEDEFGVERDELMKRLLKKGIDTRTFFIPMHQQTIFNKKMGLFRGERYPVAEELSQRGFYLPSSSGLKESEIDYICEAIAEMRGG